MKVSTVADLKKAIGHIINNSDNTGFPQEITFNRGLEHDKFKITIDQLEEDFFIDSKGKKWIKVKEEDKE
jgi:hypothetical protein